LNVIDRQGRLREIEAPAQGSLMEVLRDFDDGVTAICGGMCSCATCHVHVAPEWAGRLDPMQGDEKELISALTFQQETSRLSCQVQLSEALDGLRVTLAPEE